MINVTIGESKPQEKPFPKLKTLKDKGGIFLFVSVNECVCLDTGSTNCWLFGDLSRNSNFEHEDFTDYNEPITIQNV